jgi:hypothetical protein
VLPDELLSLRLANQHLAGPLLNDPTRLVAHLGAVQSQDYAGAKWALGQRLREATDGTLELAFAAGAILRTHVLRPTWHFVAPADIRWLLALSAPRVKAALAYYDRTLGLDEAVFARSNGALARALEGGKHLTRAELHAALRRAGIAADAGQALGHLVMHAELDAVVCSGPRRGKQVTYALLDERVPPGPRLDRDQALAELTARYFTSHGPATVRDCAWWSGLAGADVERGLALCGARLIRETTGGRTYWLAPAAPPALSEAAYLLPNYDEYTLAYKDRDLFYDPARAWTPDRREDVPFGNVLVLAGRVAGTWKRTLGKGAVALDVGWFAEPSQTGRRAVAGAAERYGAFLGRRPEPVAERAPPGFAAQAPVDEGRAVAGSPASAAT